MVTFIEDSQPFLVNEPVSGRVRHAAEEVLNLLFKTQTNDSLIDEGSLGEENLGKNILRFTL